MSVWAIGLIVVGIFIVGCLALLRYGYKRKADEERRARFEVEWEAEREEMRRKEEEEARHVELGKQAIREGGGPYKLHTGENILVLCFERYKRHENKEAPWGRSWRLLAVSPRGGRASRPSDAMEEKEIRETLSYWARIDGSEYKSLAEALPNLQWLEWSSDGRERTLPEPESVVLCPSGYWHCVIYAVA